MAVKVDLNFSPCRNKRWEKQMNAITMPGFGDEATWGPCTGHPLDPRTPELTEDEEAAEDLNDAISAAISELRAAPDAHKLPNSAERAALDAVHILASVVPVLRVLGGITISRREMGQICCHFAARLGNGMTQDQRGNDPAISALDAAADVLGGAQ